MNDAALLFAFWGAFGLALMSPGPNFAVMLATSLTDGRGRALRVAAGFGVGEAIWGLAAVFGVAALVAAEPALATALRWGGGAFLLYLGLRSLVSALKPGDAPDPIRLEDGRAKPGDAKGVWRGLGVMMLNAKAGVFWLSLTSLILGPDRPIAVGLIAVAGAVAMSLAWHALLAVTFSASTVQRAYAKLRRGLDALLGTVLAALGVKMIATGSGG